MSKIDGYDHRIVTSPVSTALSPVKSVSGTRDPAHRTIQQELFTAALPNAEVRHQLETRAELLRHSVLNESMNRDRNISVVNAYLSLQIHQEREEISKLIGVNEYA